MKEKLLSALKTKYKNLGLSDKVLEGVAETLATTTTDEANIETAVAGVESLLKSFQSDGRGAVAVNGFNAGNNIMDVIAEKHLIPAINSIKK